MTQDIAIELFRCLKFDLSDCIRDCFSNLGRYTLRVNISAQLHLFVVVFILRYFLVTSENKQLIVFSHACK